MARHRIKGAKDEFKLIIHFRKHQDRWFTATQLFRRLRIDYNILSKILVKFVKERKLIARIDYDCKGHPNIYKYQRDDLDELIEMGIKQRLKL